MTPVPAVREEDVELDQRLVLAEPAPRLLGVARLRTRVRSRPACALESAAAPVRDREALRCPRMRVTGDDLQPGGEGMHLAPRSEHEVRGAFRRFYDTAVRVERRHPVGGRVGASAARRCRLAQRLRRRAGIRRLAAEERVRVRDAGLVRIDDRIVARDVAQVAVAEEVLAAQSPRGARVGRGRDAENENDDE